MRHIEWIFALALLALLALMLLQGGQEPQTDAGTALEARLEAVLSQVEGAGRVRVLVREKESVPAFSQQAQQDQIEGVVVVCEGADSIRVALELARAVRALLGVDMERIEVLRMERGDR